MEHLKTYNLWLNEKSLDQDLKEQLKKLSEKESVMNYISETNHKNISLLSK